jgi:hypothetical protein
VVLDAAKRRLNHGPEGLCQQFLEQCGGRVSRSEPRSRFRGRLCARDDLRRSRVP